MDDLANGAAAPVSPGPLPASAYGARHVTPTPAPSPDPRATAREAFARAHEAADALMHAVADLGGAAESLTAGDLDWLVQQAQTLANRHDRVRVRALDVVRQAREAGRARHDDDAQYTAGRTRTDVRQMGRDAGLAERLGNHQPALAAPGGTGAGTAGSSTDAPGATAAPQQTPAAQAWDEGAITRAHALVITGALDDLPEELSAEQRLEAERILVAKAGRMKPAALRREARRILHDLGFSEREADAHHNELVRSEEDAAWAAARFWMTDRGDGTVHGQFTLPVLQGRMLAKALQAMTSPRHLAHKQRAAQQTAGTGTGTGTADSGTGMPGAGAQGTTTAPGGSWKDHQFDWAHERGKALAELIDHLPTDQLGSKVNAILLVTTDLETLRGETDRAGVTDTGDEISAGQVRRLASNAGIIPVVMGGDSLPLDLGRQERFFTQAQRTALATRYTSCAEEHCDRPFSWCEIHHDIPWAPVRGPGGRILDPGGGRTDLANAIPLCGRHHRRLSDPEVTHTTERQDDGTAVVRFHRRGEPEPTRRPAGAPGERPRQPGRSQQAREATPGSIQ